MDNAVDSFDIFRAQIIHAVVGRETVVVEDDGALDRLCERLVEAETAHSILRSLGYGTSWNSLPELVRLVPHSTTMLIRPKK
jgi:hypothetical protein